MSIEIKREGSNGLDKAYFRGNKFQHNTGNSIKIFPFRTKGAEKCLEEFRLFHGVVGEAFRICDDQKFAKEFESDKESSFNSKLKNHIIDNVLEIVQTENQDELKDSVINLFFGDNGELIKFHGKVLPFMNFTQKHAALREIAYFITDVFLDKTDVKEVIAEHDGENNLFYQLIIDCLPQQKEHDYDSKHVPYLSSISEITELFRKDFDLLKSDRKSFLDEIESLFKFYYFFYMTQLSKRLNKFGDLNDIDPIFFTMDWESLSGSRLGYQFGWRVMSGEMESLFAHSNTLELLNYIEIKGKAIGDYSSLIKLNNELNESDRIALQSKIKEVLRFYKEGNNSVFENGGHENVDQRILNYQSEEDIELVKLIKSLFVTVNFVLEKTGRSTAAKRYGDWLTEFCKVNFTKSRGRLGSTTTLTQEVLLFLVKLCVGKEDKIRLNKLWNELEKRGIRFDEVSKTEIIRLFERINLLEKKSDSGDAQYVKSII